MTERQHELELHIAVARGAILALDALILSLVGDMTSQAARLPMLVRASHLLSDLFMALLASVVGSGLGIVRQSTIVQDASAEKQPPQDREQ